MSKSIAALTLTWLLLSSFAFLAKGEEESNAVESATKNIIDPCNIYSSCVTCTFDDACFFDRSNKECKSKTISLVTGYCNGASSLFAYKVLIFAGVFLCFL